MTTADGIAPAKVNMTLHVTGCRPDGYHLLDSLVVFVDGVADQITVSPSEDLSLIVDGPMAAGVPADDSNLVMKAARFLDAGGGAKIRLTKNLPAAAGIGGGSSDAAAVLRLLSKQWGVEIPGDTARLGADVPVCLSNDPQRMRGVGEELEPVFGFPSASLVLVNPGVAIATSDAFRALNGGFGPAMPDRLPVFAEATALAGWLAVQRNDLEAPSRSLAPVIGEVLEALDDALLARMSGSGATCFGLFPDDDSARRGASRIAAQRPDWWVTWGAVHTLS